jgi:chemotaxis protein methyltransferase CheR
MVPEMSVPRKMTTGCAMAAKSCGGKDQMTGIAPLHERDFCRFSELIQEKCGIHIPLSKKSMLEARLQKRLRCLVIPSFDAYGAYLFSQAGMHEELPHLIDVVTTNKSDFFREAAHFEFLAEKIVREFAAAGPGRKLKVWSAGCSTGEEAYTLAMVLSEATGNYSGLGFLILATDISTIVLEKAKLGIYEEEKTVPVPWDLKRKYFMINRDRSKRLVRIVPELRSRVTFMHFNLVDKEFCLAEQKDVIFCRNVIIYFNRATQEKLLGQLCSRLVPGGYLFLGHSETLNGFNLPLIRIDSTIYRKQK